MQIDEQRERPRAMRLEQPQEQRIVAMPQVLDVLDTERMAGLGDRRLAGCVACKHKPVLQVSMTSTGHARDGRPRGSPAWHADAGAKREMPERMWPNERADGNQPAGNANGRAEQAAPRRSRARGGRRRRPPPRGSLAPAKRGTKRVQITAIASTSMSQPGCAKAVTPTSVEAGAFLPKNSSRMAARSVRWRM